MRFLLAICIVWCAASVGVAKTSKKSITDVEGLPKKPKTKSPAPNAIIAIEIVDPEEEKSGKNSKRTIDSSLGYGYGNNAYHQQPKYEVYKYSQHDIPAYRGPNTFFRSQGIKSENYDLQKSVSYQLPQQQQFYQPGTTLFSTVNGQGHATGLSSYLPQEPQVPVIILRVLPSQLNDPSAILHPNLPRNHPLAATINSIDIQSLLANYMQNLLQQHYVQQPQQQQLLTYENYPRDTHTRVVFKGNTAPVQPEPETKTIQVQLPADGTYSNVQVESSDAQYDSNGYYDDQNSNDYYYPPQQQYQEQDYQEPNYYQYSNQDYQENQQEEVQSTTPPYNYHAHQKRSKRPKFEDIRLKPIKAAKPTQQ